MAQGYEDVVATQLLLTLWLDDKSIVCYIKVMLCTFCVSQQSGIKHLLTYSRKTIRIVKIKASICECYQNRYIKSMFRMVKKKCYSKIDYKLMMTFYSESIPMVVPNKRIKYITYFPVGFFMSTKQWNPFNFYDPIPFLCNSFLHDSVVPNVP